MKRSLFLLCFILLFVSVANSGQITNDDALKSIAIFDKSPLNEDGKQAASIILRFASESEEVTIALSAAILPWIKNKDKNTSQFNTILLSAYIAGNVKSQLLKKTASDDPFGGYVQVLKTYDQIQQAHPDFKIEEIEEFEKHQQNGTLKDYVSKLISNKN